MVKSQKVPAKDEMRYTCIPFAKKELNFNTTCYLAKKEDLILKNILQISNNFVMAKTNSQLIIVFCLRRTVVFESLKDY